MAHTSGPWKRAHNANGENYVYAVRGGTIAICYGSNDGEDAELISAAPELLEALKMAYEDIPGWVGLARKAIAKAEGDNHA